MTTVLSCSWEKDSGVNGNGINVLTTPRVHTETQDVYATAAAIRLTRL